ncbi:MAG: signal peptidase I [Flavobacteriaceae bacterium]|nr:signal peptidase I [Flavobacteriaceae bacterium]MCY4266891.1 signal peptidase I [Flavobacteriaceae bacterium]
MTQWILFFLLLNLIHFGGTFRLYQAAGKKPYLAIIPFYNLLVLLRIVHRPKWWFILFFLPTINLIMIGVLWVETLKVFGKSKTTDILLGLFTFGFYIYFLNYSRDIEYAESIDRSKRSSIAETFSSIVFAVIVATIVHNYFIQPYIIPTGSLEKSLLVGDFLLVSKFHYGSRIPTTAVSLPLVHDTLPLVKKRSYLKNPQYPYLRLPRLQKIQRNDIVVFNWPADTVRRFFVAETRVNKPLDKKSNYVKRCVGIPGDTLEIINGFVHIDDKKNKLPDRAKIQLPYQLYNSNGVSSKNLVEKKITGFNRKYRIDNITPNSFKAIQSEILYTTGSSYSDLTVVTSEKGLSAQLVSSLGLQGKEILERVKTVFLTPEEAQTLTKVQWLDSIKQKINTEKRPNTSFFPNKIPFAWNEDNFGPIIIPKKGETITLTSENRPLYKKLIIDYEHNTLESGDFGFRINGLITDQYTFKQNYYWMMGDNRHKSEDSRFWGFVPEDHIVGKPIFIWFSIENFTEGIRNWKIRWDRVFTTISGKGEAKSYFPHFVGLIVLWQITAFILKRRKKRLIQKIKK